jgi:hypothetical protein
VTTLLSRNSFWGGGLARDSAGNFYVIVLTENQVFRVTPAGTITSFAGRASAGSADGFGSAAEFNFPRDVAADTAGNLYVADSGNHTIRRITPDGNVTTFAGLAGSRGFADGPGTTARFNLPRSVTVDGAGNLYVSDLANHAIRRITPAGIVSTIAGDPTRVGIAIGDVPGSLSAPAGIWVLPGPGTRLAVTDTVENVVLLITLP